MEVVAGATCTLGGEVWNLAVAPIKPKTSGTIYAKIQLNKPGDADHGKYWDINAGGSWQASPTTWPSATYQTGAFWSYAVPAGATTGKSDGYIDLVDLTDNLTPASSTVLAGGFQSARVVTAATSTYLANLDATVGSRSTFAGGAVASVTGDVGGKVLGGGASSISGVGANANITQIDGNATNDNLATLKLKQLHIVNSAGDAVYAASTGSNGHGANLNGNGSGNGLRAISGTSGHGIYAKGGAGSNTQAGLRVEGGGAGPGLSAVGAISGGAGSGIFAGSGGSGHGVEAAGAATGHGIKATSGSGASGDGINASAASTNGSGLRAVGSGAGIDLTGSLSGDVHGKILGEGASSIIGVGARVVDASGNNVASESTAAAIQAKTDNLPLSPAATGDIPLASDNASAVRTELSPELANMDSPISDCLQASSYVAPDNATIASTAAGVLALPAAITASESAIRGADADTLEILSDQIDALSSIIPLGHGNVLIRIVDEDGAPIDGVRVTIYDMSGNYAVYGYTGGFTPGTGEVHFNLPASAGGISYNAYFYQAGTSFLPEAVKTFAVKDPPVGPDFNEFEYEGQLGMSGVMTTFVVVDTETPTPNPVENVRVRIFSSPADTFLTEVSTDVNGEVSTILEGAAGPSGREYIIRLAPPSGYSSGPTRTISVIDPLGPSETNVFDFTVYPPSEVPVSLDPDMCKVSGTFTNPSLHPLKNITLIFHPREGYPNKVIAGMPFSAEPTIVRSNIIASDLHVTTDKNGYIEIELPRKSVFDVFVQGLGAGDNTLQASIYIPDMAGIDVREVLFPYLTTLTYMTASLNMTSGDSEEVEVELTSSNGQPITGVVALNALLVFESSDPTVALASIGSNGTLVIKALKAGSITVQASRVVGSFAPRRPEVPDLVIAPSVLTVTVT